MSYATISAIIHARHFEEMIGGRSAVEHFDRRIAQELEKAKEEGHISRLEGIIDRCRELFPTIESVGTVTDDAVQNTKRHDMRDAFHGNSVFAARIRRIVGEPWADDAIDIYSLARDHSLQPVLKSYWSARDRMTTAEHASARAVLEHVLPIAARRQPQVAMTYAALYLPETGRDPFIDPEQGATLLKLAAHRAPEHGVKLKRAMLDQERLAKQISDGGCHAANAEFLGGLMYDSEKRAAELPKPSHQGVQRG